MTFQPLKTAPFNIAHAVTVMFDIHVGAAILGYKLFTSTNEVVDGIYNVCTSTVLKGLMWRTYMYCTGTPRTPNFKCKKHLVGK